MNKDLAADGAPGIEYQRFVARWNDPNDKTMQAIKANNLVKKFDKNGLVVNTKAENPDEPEVQGQPGKGSDVLDRTAKAAAKRAMK